MVIKGRNAEARMINYMVQDCFLYVRCVNELAGQRFVGLRTFWPNRRIETELKFQCSRIGGKCLFNTDRLLF